MQIKEKRFNKYMKIFLNDKNEYSIIADFSGVKERC